MSVQPESMRVQSGDLKLAARIWRREGRPTLVLVHGYPDDSSVWDEVVERLASHCQVVTYDVRGHGDSQAPDCACGYRYEHLVADLAAVIDVVSPTQPVHLVAHDWGSIQCWEAVAADRLKGRIASYTSISGPCLDHAALWFRRCVSEGGLRGCGQALGQLCRSWYMFFFQLPWLAPLVWRLLLARLWPRLLWRNEGIRIEANPRQLRNCVNGINLYRANFLPRMFRPRQRHADIPVLLIVPTRDPYISPQLYSELPRWVPDLRREDVDSGHWLPLKRPDELAASVKRFVAGEGGSSHHTRSSGTTKSL